MSTNPPPSRGRKAGPVEESLSGRETTRESETKYQALVDHSLTGIIITTANQICFANRTFEEITGYTQDDLAGMGPWDMVHPEERDRVREMGLRRLRRKPTREYYETRWIHRDGRTIWVEVRATVVQDRGRPAVLASVVDITERKTAEDELAFQAKKLEEANTALKVLLQRREEDQRELAERVMANVKDLVVPFLDQVRATGLSRRQLDYLDLIESNLRQITSPFSRNLSARMSSLTPKEIQIAGLIREGRTSKDIAAMLGVTQAAVDFHRNNIRKKLGLNRNKANLRSYLLSLS